ncbi:MAG: hypothetical protein LJE64_07215 [Desulfofustis sp.]|jgi:hypothetical protein|nr:hypothetical protein [Desulfofustis sp.]
MPCANPDALLRAGILLITLLLGGCAPTPWTTPVEDGLGISIKRSYLHFSETQNQCRAGWDADLLATIRTTLNDVAFSAYLQALPPSLFKLVISNPLGQPLKLITTDGAAYHYIDTLARSSITGSIRSWAVRSNLPYTLISRPWPDWLQGRPGVADQGTVTAIRQDGKGRGAWLTIGYTADKADQHNGEKESGTMPARQVSAYLLVEPETGIVKEMIVVDERQKPQATIRYTEWQQVAGCLYPVDIEVTGLPYGGYIHLKFSNLQQAELVPGDFQIRTPAGFSRTMLP